MALEVEWYGLICVGIVGVAVVGSLYELWSNKEVEHAEAERLKNGTPSIINDDLHERLMISTGRSSSRPAGAPIPLGYVSSSELWTTCWRGLHPAWLLAIRLLCLFLVSGFLAWDLQQWGPSIFIYYTEWTSLLAMMYFAIGSVVSAHGCWLMYTHRHSGSYFENIGESEVGGDIEESRTTITRTFRTDDCDSKLRSYYHQEQALQKVGFWGYLIQTAYQTCAGAVILTDVVFWAIIVPFISLSSAHLGLNLLMACMHTVNAATLLLETCINRLAFPWFRFAYFVLWSSAYVVFQWIIHLCGFTWWPYPFLELSTPWAPVWYLVLVVSHIACYGLYALIVRGKDSLFAKLFPNSYIRSQ